MKKIDSISIQPSTNIIDVLGHAGYTFEYAIADIVDNSIAAHAKNIDIFINIQDKNPYIFILDDGDGMSNDDLNKAAILAYKSIDDFRNDDDLGRYSTGLKSAAKSIANNMFISTKQNNNLPNTIQIDFNHIKQSGKWEAFSINDFEFNEYLGEQGTIVVCDNLKIIGNDFNLDNIYLKIEQLEKKLSHIFGKYIISKKVSIRIKTPNNKTKGVEVQGWNPFSLLENKTTKLVLNKEINYNNSSIVVNTYILPVYNNLSTIDQNYMIGNGLINQQGFYIYRNDRLIQEGGWLDLPGISFDQKCNYARIEVNITQALDECFNVTFSKNKITLPNELIPVFIEIAKKARIESKNNFNYMKHPDLKPKITSKEEKVWNISKSSKGMSIVINQEHTIIKKICSSLSDSERKKLFSLLSKSIPVSIIQGQAISQANYTHEELISLVDEMFKQLISKGLSLKEIKNQMARTEPFKTYNDVLIEYFDNLEEK